MRLLHHRLLLLALLLVPLAACREEPLDPRSAADDGEWLLEQARLLRGSMPAEPAAVDRIGGLERQYGEAIALVAERHGADRASALLSRRERLLESARAAAREGQRTAAQAAFEEARREQIRVVLTVIGAERVATLLADVGSAADETASAVDRLRSAGLEVDSHQRMLRSASELISRAAAAFAEGDAGAALDLGSHAAGLLDTIRMRLGDTD